MRFKRAFLDYAGWSEKDAHLSSFKRWGRVPGTGSSTDFLYTDRPACPMCGSSHRIETKGVYRDCFIRHTRTECLLVGVKTTVRDELTGRSTP